MVAIFAGAGAGFVRGSANLLGGAGQLGGAALGRGGEQVSLNAATGNLLINRQDEFLVGLGPDIGIARSYNSLAEAGDGDNGDNWQQSTTRRVFGLTGTANAAGSTVSRLSADGSVLVYSWDDGRAAYSCSAGSGAIDTLTLANDTWTWRDGDSQSSESYAAHGADNWRIVSASDADGNTLSWSYLGDKLDKVTTADGAWTQYVWSGNTITDIVTGYTDLATATAKTLTRTRYAYDASNRLAVVTTDLSPEDASVADGKVYTTSYTYDGASSSVASIAQGDGSLVQFTYDTQGRVATVTQAVTGSTTRVTSLAYGAGYTDVTGPDGQVTRLAYDAALRLTRITLPPAYAGAAVQETVFAYDAAGNVTSVTDGNGKVTTYEYNSDLDVTRKVDANGNVTEWAYAGPDRPSVQTTYGVDQTGASAAQYTRYAYDAEGHLRFIVSPQGQVTQYTYTASGQILTKRLYPQHTYPAGATPVSEAAVGAWLAGLGDLGSAQVVTYVYDARGNLVREEHHADTSAAGEGASTGVITRVWYTYDQAGQLLSTASDGEGAESFIYDGLGRVVSSGNGLGGTTTVVFNDAASTTTVTTAGGYVTVSTYNKAGDLVSEAHSAANTTSGTAGYQYDASGRLRIATDASGRTSYAVYDKLGRKVADVNHLGEMVAYRYDLADRLVATTRYATPLSAAQLALLANPNSTAELSALLPAGAAADMWSWTVYDNGSRVIQSIGSDGSVAGFVYDASDRLIRTTSSFTRLTAVQIAALKLALPTVPVSVSSHAKDAVTRQFYDAAGQLIGTLNAQGYLSEIVYDGAGHTIQDIAYATLTLAADRASGSFATLRAQVAGGSTVDRVTRYVYDRRNQLAYVIDGLGGVTGYLYNSAGALTTTRHFATALNPSQTAFAYAAVQGAVVASGADRIGYTVYNGMGRAAYTVDAEGGVTGYTYDTAGRVIRVIQFADIYNAAAGLPALAAMQAWAADPAQASDAGNRVTRNWHNERGDLRYTVDAGGYLRGFTYDAEGRAIGQSAWANAVVVADSASLAQLATAAAGAGAVITVSSSYDNAGRLLTSTDGEGIVTRHVYNALGQLTDTYVADNVAADTVRRHYEYDGAGRLVADYQAYGSAQQIGTFWAYDGLGNRVSTTDANGHITTFAFDALGRVTSATNALSGVTAYVYDAFGNVLKVTDPRGNAGFTYYDRLNRAIATRDAAGYVTRTIYNGFGDVLSVERYSAAMTAPGQAGVAVFDPLLVPTDPFAYADSLQAIADDKDTLADQAEANVPVKQAAASTAAQAASDADALVASLQAQITALGGPQPIDFSAERAAALANASTWTDNRGEWLLTASNALNSLSGNAAYNDEITRFKATLEGERTIANTLSLFADEASYINKFYDNLTIQRGTLSADKAGALAGQMAWLQARKADLVNWITQYDYGIISYNFFTAAKAQWLSIVRAIYDLTNNTYSTGWPTTSSNISAFYTTAQSNPAYLPSGIQNTTSYAADFRSLAFINVFYDAKTVINDPYGAAITSQQQAQQLQVQLATATSDATAAHNASDGAALTASNAQSNAIQLRGDAVQAQGASDAAYAAALANAGGPVLQDNFVLLDLAQLGSATVTRFGYDRLGQATWKVDAENYVEGYKYDAFGQQTSVTRFSGQIAAGLIPNLVTPVYGTASETKFAYNSRGSLTSVTDAEGYFESFAYDAYGQRVSHTGKSATAVKVAGAVTAYAYDKRGLLVSETLPMVSYTSAGAVQAITVTNTYIYDARGNLLSKTQAQGLTEQRRTDYAYDKLDRLIETKGDSVSGLTINTATKAVSAVSGRPTETVTYDACGNVIMTVDAAGARTVAFFDALNRKIAEINALGTYTAYEYDANGNVTRVRVFDTMVTQPATGGTAAQAPAVPAGTFRETTFTYDSRNQVLASNMLGVTTGQASGSSWASASGAITTAYQYDADGNAVKVTDPNGNALWTYYDRLGRKIAQVDGGNFLTRWVYDAEGHVTEERRYATAVAAPAGSAVPPSGSNSADDRITQYTYDRNGNRLSEARLNVQYHNGSGGYSTGTATIACLYNGLGQVTRRTEATGDQTNYTYDAAGRLTREVKAQGAVDYFYDGTGNLARNVKAAVNGTQARTTTYAYGAGGRLASMTDAGGYVHSYYYDVAGHMVLESYVRSNSAGTATTEAIGHRFDVLGRNLGQAYYTKSGTTWALQGSGDTSSLEYNAHGEVTRIGINGLWQQESKYDAAGRVWASNTGDGVWKYFGYDRNGNRTLTVTSAGTSLAGQASIAAAYGQVSAAGVNGTLTAYDARNLATTVREEGRQLTGSGATELVTSRTYNAFGDVTSETAPNSGVTSFTYNTLGKAITVQRPTVSITTEAGIAQNVASTDRYYFDLSGRMTGQRDANSNLTRYTLLAGSGHGGAQALVSQEIHADGGTVTTLYNAHGDATQVTDAVGLVTTMAYDNLDRLTQVNNPGGLIDYYTYDVLGQRLTHYNNLLGSTNKETTDFDVQGRITSQRAFGGDVTGTSYVWSSTLATTGLGTFGGWTETITYANSKTVINKNDLFNRAVQHTDMGGFVTASTYDAGGRLVATATGTTGNTSGMAYVYYNTGQLKQSTLSYVTQTYYWDGTTIQFGTETNAVTATYTYDKMGNRLSEVGTTTINGGAATTWKNQSATYDALGRMKTWAEAGTTNSPAADITYAYDAVGNIRRSNANYRPVNPDGTVPTSASVQDNWFRYDTMNRLVMDRGMLSGGVIVRNAFDSNSKLIAYDKAGRRTDVQSLEYIPGAYIYEFGWFPGMSNEQREIYSYDAAGRLAQVDLSKGAVVADGGGIPPAAPTTGTKRAAYIYDAMGRMTSQIDYEADGITAAYDRAITYNAKNQISTDTTVTKRGSDSFLSVNTYDYGTGTAYALGSVLSVTSKNYKNNNDGNAKDTSTVNAYAWRDGAMQSTITFDGDTGSTSNTIYTTSMYYDAAGRLTGAYIGDGKPRSVAYTLDEAAQIIRRDETRPSNAPSAQIGSPHEVWYRYGGREMGYTGNNATQDMDYESSIAERQLVPLSNPGTFRNGYMGAISYADFAQSADPINSYSQGAAGGSYVVRTGDTLQSIAQAVWGDSSLWYKLADANGITGNAGLIEGQVLQLPAGVIRNTHNAGTANPYDPTESIGNLSPTTMPKPPKKKGCGALGPILLAVVAIAVTAIVAPELIGYAAGTVLPSGATATAATGLTAVLGTTGAGIVGGGLAAVAGSIAAQAVGLATGVQDKFSFKNVALAALGGAIGGGLNASGLFGNTVDGAFQAGSLGIKSAFVDAALQGAAGSAMSQGIAVATGLQSKFDFVGVAAAGIGAGGGQLVGGRLGLQPLNGAGADLSAGNIAGHILSGTASAIANAATRSAIGGENFGDNLMRALPDALGNTIGNALAGVVARSGQLSTKGLGAGADGTSDQQTLNVGGEWGSSADMQFDGIVVTARFNSAEYRTSNYENYFHLAQYRPNPRARMGGNGGPPIYDPMTLRDAAGPIINTPAGPVLSVVDGFLDLTGPASRLARDSYTLQRNKLIRELEALDPKGSYLSLSEPGTSQGRLNVLNDLRARRAAMVYFKTGDTQLLQVETLRTLQSFVDEGYAIGSQRFEDKLLSPRLSKNEAVGNYVDRYARRNIQNWYNQYGVVTGSILPIGVNNRAYAADSSYRIPDVRVGSAAFDMTLSLKTISTPQVRGFFNAKFAPSSVTIVRPTVLGGSYIIQRPRR